MRNHFFLEALTLTLFGMGFVFVFLLLMVIVTSIMSLIIEKTQPVYNSPSLLNQDPVTEIDTKTRAIIVAAIKMHTKR